MFSQQLKQVIEDLPMMSLRSGNPDSVVDLDNMYEPPEFIQQSVPDTNRTGLSGLEMDRKDLELLGFMVVEDDQPKQRNSRIQVTYTATEGGTMKRNVELTPDDEGNEPESKAPGKGAFNLVLKSEKTIEQQVHSMDQSYQKHRENRLKGVSVKMTPEIFHQIQLNKLFQVAEIIQKKRVQHVMQRMLSFSSGFGSDKFGTRVIKTGIKEKQGGPTTDMLTFSQRQVDMYFNQWGDVLKELPQSLREDIMKLSRPKVFDLKEKAVKLEEQQQHMYLITEGHALLFQNEYLYKKFNNQLEAFQNRQKQKYQLISRPNFSNLVHVGTIILKYVQKNEIIRHILARGKRRLEAKKAEEKIYAGDSGLIKLSPGSVFGDFQEANGRIYKPQQVVSMSEPLKCIMINRNDLKKLYSRILTPENLALIRGRIPPEQMSHNIVKKILRCFNEKEFPPGKVLLEEGKPLNSIYIIKSGICQMYSYESPLKARNKTLEDKFFFKLPASGQEISLGLNQGSMSKAFNHYPLSEVGQGTWIGEEAFYMDSGSKLTYSIRCKTIVKVLEIGLQDFEARMPQELSAELKNIAIRKQFMRYMRMQEIIKTSADVKEREALHEFHSRALQSIIKMHPHASKRIITQLGNQFQLEGFQRTARYRDAINVGEIKAKEKVAVSPFATGAADTSVERQMNTSMMTEESTRHSPSPAVTQGIGFERKFSEVQIEKKESVQALSPGGKPLLREMETKQNLLNLKVEALKQANVKKVPVQVVNQFNKASTTKISPRHDKKLKLTRQKQEQLFGLGVDQNNHQMLSLASINSMPLTTTDSPRSPVQNQEESMLKFDPTEAQMVELEKLLQKRSRHPILEMRLQTAIKDRLAKKSTHVKLLPAQIFRSITFFNTEQAERERAQETIEKKQVFKLSKSVERLVTLQPTQGTNESFDGSLRHNQCSNQFLESISYIPESSKRLRHNGTTNPFLKSSLISSQSMSPLQKKASGNPSNLHLNQSLRASIGRTASPFTDKLTQKQSCLYHAQKVSQKDIQNLQDIKHALHLHRSLQFKTGSFQVHNTYETAQQYQKPKKNLASLNFGMINQHSSTIQIEPGMFDEEEERQFLKQPRQNHEHFIQEGMRHEDSKQKLSSMPSRDSPAFRLDLSRISVSRARQNSDDMSLVQDSEAKKVKDHVRFEMDDQQERGLSRLQVQMLKDLKDVNPEYESARLALLPDYDAPLSEETKNKIKPANMEEDGDVRYLEPPQKPNTTTETNIGITAGGVSVQGPQKVELSQSDHEKAFQEYLHVSRKHMEEELGQIDDTNETKSEDLLHQPSEKRLEPKHESSDSHASVLEAIEQTVSLYSNERDPRNRQISQSWEAVNEKINPILESLEKVKISDLKSNAAILNEMLSTRQRQIMKQRQTGHTVKSLKTGSFKVQNLTSLQYIPQSSGMIQKLLSPSSISPLRVQMARSKSPRLNHTSVNMQKVALSKFTVKKAKNRYATLDDRENEYSAEQRFATTAHKNISGLKISQISLRGAEPSKRTKVSERRETENHSKLSHPSKSPSPSQLRQSKPKQQERVTPEESSLFKQPNHKLVKLATKQSSPRRKAQASGRQSVQESGKNSQTVPPDLAMVMDNSEINFKRKKAQVLDSKSPGDRSPSRTVKIDLTYDQMRKTMQLDQVGTLFPSINQEENARFKGTANYETQGDRKSRDLMDSTGTKYYISSHVPVTSQHSQTRADPNNEVVLMNVTYQNLSTDSRKSKKRNSDYDIGLETLLPTVSKSKVGKREKNHMNLFEGADIDTSRAEIEQGMDKSTDSIMGGAADVHQAPSIGRITSLSKIKIAIEKSAQKRRQAKESDSKRDEYVKEEKQQTSTNFPHRKLINLKAKRLKKDIFTKNAETHFEQAQFTKQNSPRVKSSMRVSQKHATTVSPRRDKDRRRGRKNEDIKHASIRGVNYSESKPHLDEMLHRSEQSSINKYHDGTANQSILSDIALQHYEHFNSQLAEHLGEAQRVTEQVSETAAQQPPQSMQVVYSPMLKHMPVLPFKHAKHGQTLKYPLNSVPARLSTELPQLSQKVSPTSSALAIVSNKGTSIKESAYIKNQKWRTIESKKLLQSGDRNKRRIMIEEDDFNQPSVMNRGSSVRRSQIIEGRSHGISLLSNEKDGSKKMARQDSVMLPQSYSKILHRSSKAGFAERQSMASLNSTSKMNMQSILRVLEDDIGEHPDRTFAGLSAAEQTKLKFQQIKDEKRRMQQQF